MTVSDSLPAPGAAPAIWGNIPQRNKNFTGREDILGQLRQGVASRVTAVLPHALQGMGGVGKTALAIEYAYRYRSEYELVWWIPADQPALVRSSLAALAEPLGLQSATAAGIDTASAAVLNALRRGEPYTRWLLIFDNADQPEDLKDILPDGPGDVLITSRNHRWESVVDTVPVDVFTREESTDFLAKRVPRGINKSEAAQLAEELGDLPLALEQAGALQAETGMPVQEYLRLLREHAAEIMAEGNPPEYPLSMTAAWKLSVTTLNRHLPQAMELLRCCAFLGPEPIPRDLFRRGTQTETRVSDLLSKPILLARAIRELGRFALVKIDGRTIQVHRLIQALLRDELDPDQQASYRHEVHLILAAGAPKNPDDNELWPRYGELVAHMASSATELPGCHSHQVRTFALDVVRYLYQSGDQGSSRLFAERFLEQWTKDSGPDDPAVLAAQRHLANALRQLGQYSAAYDLDEATLGRARKILGERDPLSLVLMNSFGADLRARGDFAGARSRDEESLGLHQAALGEDDPRTLRVMNSLALDHGLNSDYVRARELHQRTFLLQSEAATGVLATEVLTSWNGLSRAVRLCGEYAEARDVGEDAYDYGQEALGPEHYLTLRAGIDLSIALRRIAASYNDALELAGDIYDRRIRLFGERHPDTLGAAISLTNIQRTIGETEQAFALAESTVARYPEVYGPDHPYNHACSGNLALLQRVTGDAARARLLNEAALAGLDNRLTRDHHYSLTVATNLASDFAVLGETAGARTLGEDTLARLRSILGESHPLTLGCAANLALDLRADGAVEEAERLSADTVGRYADTLGAEHADTIAATEGRRLDFDFDPPPI